MKQNVILLAAGALFSLLVGFISGCWSAGPFADVGTCVVPGCCSRGRDLLIGYAEEDGYPCWIQYRLTLNDLLHGNETHASFLSTNCVVRNGIVSTLESNIVSFVQKEKRIVVVKGRLPQSVSKDKKQDEPETLFVAFYDETPPTKALALILPTKEHVEPLATYAFPVHELEKCGLRLFPKIPDGDRIKRECEIGDWSWQEADAKVNRCDVIDPKTGQPIFALFGTDVKAVSEEEAARIATDKYVVLKITSGKSVSPYSEDGKIKYSSGYVGAIERWHYELAPDEGPYWLYLDDECVRVHKPGCSKYEKGRGRHTQIDAGQLAECCADR